MDLGSFSSPEPPNLAFPVALFARQPGCRRIRPPSLTGLLQCVYLQGSWRLRRCGGDGDGAAGVRAGPGLGPQRPYRNYRAGPGGAGHCGRYRICREPRKLLQRVAERRDSIAYLSSLAWFPRGGTFLPEGCAAAGRGVAGLGIFLRRWGGMQFTIFLQDLPSYWNWGSCWWGLVGEAGSLDACSCLGRSGFTGVQEASVVPTVLTLGSTDPRGKNLSVGGQRKEGEQPGL